MSTKTTTTTPNDPTVCKVCGKHLTREASAANEMGHRCERLLEAGWDAESLSKHYAKVTVTEVPDGYIKLAELHKKVKAAQHKVPGLTISKMVKAIGRDRGLEAPSHPIATPVYDTRKHRWVNGWLATAAGLKAIATGDWSKAPTK